eukprot:Stramenopile-MAST_4_protein_3337
MPEKKKVRASSKVEAPRQVANRFDLTHKISEGSFGQVFMGIDSKTGTRVAVKLEAVSSKSQQLLHEADVYKGLQTAEGIPKVLWSGTDGSNNVLVLDLLGPDLDELFDFCGRQFSNKTVLQFGLHAISLLEHVHRCGYIYRDMKPQNFLVGHGMEGAGSLYILDFGLTKAVSDVTKKRGRGLVGTARYASISAHRGDPPSFRDDMESLGYIMIYFCRGSLPWSGIKAKTTKEKYALIANKKMDVSLKDLCSGHDQGYAAFIQYCRNLRPEQPIDYNKLRKMVTDIADRTGVNFDGYYDWMETQYGADGRPADMPDPCNGPLRVKNDGNVKGSRDRRESRRDSILTNFESKKTDGYREHRRSGQALRSAKVKLGASRAFAKKGDFGSAKEGNWSGGTEKITGRGEPKSDGRSHRSSSRGGDVTEKKTQGSNLCTIL